MPTLTFQRISLHNFNQGTQITSLGIDPGLGTLGYGVVLQCGSRLQCERYGVIKTPTNLPIHERLLCLRDDLCKIFLAVQPDIVAVEKLFFGRNITTAEMVWQARGIVMLLCAENGLTPYELTPGQAKESVCGDYMAEKGQVQRMVAQILSLDKNPTPDDAADALAIAITGLSLHCYDRNTLRGV